MAVLSQLAYSKGGNRPLQGESLYDVLVGQIDTLRDSLGSNYDSVIGGLLEKTESGGYEIVKSTDDKYGSGFAAIAIKDPSNEVTVACRGTEGFDLSDKDSLTDMAADGELSYALSTSQQKKMQSFMHDLEKSGHYDGYHFTGHSLGGNLALYGAITMKPQNKVKNVITFNAPGFNEAFMLLHAYDIAKIDDKIKNYQNEYDYVSSIMTVPGRVIIVESSFDGDHSGFDDHSLCNLTVSDSGFAKKKPQIKSVQAYVGHIIIEMGRALLGPAGVKAIVGAIEICVTLGRFADQVINVATKILDKISGKIGDSAGPYIKVNTASLRNYADRLSAVNRRLDMLDGWFDSLYWRVGFWDLWDLIQADALTGESWKINRCIQYLRETANDFENVENTIINKL